jgi:MYXO-CTERM domain-containing protein
MLDCGFIMPTVPTWRILLAGLAASLAPRVAQACSCGPPYLQEPRPGATDVPVNTKIWYLPPGPRIGATFRLEGPAGDAAMDMTVVSPGARFAPFTGGFVFTPRQPLTPGATYRFLVCVDGNCQGDQGFTVGSRRLDSAALPRELSRQPLFISGDPRSSCGPAAIQLINFKFEWDGIALLADVDGDNHFSPVTFQDLLLHTATRAAGQGLNGELGLGLAPCSDWPRDASGNPVLNPRLRFGVLDIAGNFSGWTMPEQVSLPTMPVPDGGSADTAAPVAPDASAPADAALTPDAGAPPGADASAPVNPDVAAPPSPPGLAQKSGCSCNLGGERGPGLAGVVLVALFAGYRRTRRRQLAYFARK